MVGSVASGTHCMNIHTLFGVEGSTSLLGTDRCWSSAVLSSHSRFLEGAHFLDASLCGWVIGDSWYLIPILVSSASTDGWIMEDKGIATTRKVRNHSPKETEDVNHRW